MKKESKLIKRKITDSQIIISQPQQMNHLSKNQIIEAMV